MAGLEVVPGKKLVLNQEILDEMKRAYYLQYYFNRNLIFWGLAVGAPIMIFIALFINVPFGVQNPLVVFSIWAVFILVYYHLKKEDRVFIKKVSEKYTEHYPFFENCSAK